MEISKVKQIEKIEVKKQAWEPIDRQKIILRTKSAARATGGPDSSGRQIKAQFTASWHHGLSAWNYHDSRFLYSYIHILSISISSTTNI